MALTAGTRISSYEIIAPIGKGGMGEVYRATDKKLGREVAIKILPEEFAHDPDRMARFQREAKLLASLNHPNIAAIYGFEESGGTNFLVLELVDGETLADQLKRGPIPLEDSLKLALQISEALEAAHEKGIIHRDLKPANIKVTPESIVKVLDFGLAKALEREATEADASQSPTLSLAATKAGVILGTAAYMAPEQARGSGVDKRCDIWSFGVVLFEMLTGKQLFAGKTISDTLAAVLRSDIDWSLLPVNTPANIRTLLRRCLTKDRKQRLQAIGDARITIEEYLINPASVSLQETAFIARGHTLRERFSWGVAFICVVGALILAILYFNKPFEQGQPICFAHNLTEDQQFASQSYPILAVAPDGRRFVYCTNNGLFLRSLKKLEAKNIIGPDEGVLNPFFSPDGKWVAYVAGKDNKLKKVSIEGGAPVPLCNVVAGSVFGPSWGADGTILYAEQTKGIMRISESGGNPETLIKSDNENFFHPRLLPDGKSVLFTLGTNEGYKIVVQSLKSGKRTILFEGDCAWYLPTGHIVYALGFSIYAAPFDPGTFQAGTSIQMIEGLFRMNAQTAPQYAVSESGALVYLPQGLDAVETKRTLEWVDRDGKEEHLNFPADTYFNPRISPDGKRIAVLIEKAGVNDIWIYNLVNGIPTRLTYDAFWDISPLWTLDNQRIVFAALVNEKTAIYSISADGAGKAEQLLTRINHYPFSWAGNRKTLILIFTGNRWDIGALSMEGDRHLKSLLNGKQNEAYPAISPDGRFLAYQSDESGEYQVYVRPYPEMDKSWQVSTNGGDSPLWSPDGRELFYRSQESVMAVTVKTDPDFSFERAKPLFPDRYVPNTSLIGITNEYHPWDISRDGRFLMMKEVETTASTGKGPRQINFVLNWSEELKQRVLVK